MGLNVENSHQSYSKTILNTMKLMFAGSHFSLLAWIQAKCGCGELKLQKPIRAEGVTAL